MVVITVPMLKFNGEPVCGLKWGMGLMVHCFFRSGPQLALIVWGMGDFVI